ncbi:response regulator [Rhizobiales bacterium RZME27]|jgi:CheY-like chemotaxis protein|uniref:Response regulator n=1 Tax=Endobacterium cereale TaxID=2663029 RepID=A0A6A8ABN7_9HYPH|nr:response regulator [Endobacterium cereale]
MTMSDLQTQRRILMVDDDVLIAMTSVDMLEELGHKVIEAHSGHEALALLGKSLDGGDRIDLMITDFSMPGMNGAELAQQARRLVPGLPILLASGYTDLPEGMDVDVGRLGKPYSQEDLASEIAKVMVG